MTNGVAMPSFNPLSMLMARRTRTGIARSTSSGRLSAASVGARIEPIRRANARPSAGNRSQPTNAPAPIVRGSPMARSRAGTQAMLPACLRPIDEASENSSRASVSSASSWTDSDVTGAANAPTPDGPRTAPIVTRIIGPLTDSRSSRAARRV